MLKRTLSACLLVLAVVAAGFVLAAPASAHVDHDCGDFATQAAAQHHYLQLGGPRVDPDGLDRDGDGIACDSNPCPCSYAQHLPPPPAITTRASLTVSASRRIAGEPLRLTAHVSPKKVRAIVLQRKTGSASWTNLRSGHTNSQGGYAYLTRARSATTKYRVVVRSASIGGRRYAGATSASKTVTTQVQSVTIQVPATVTVKKTAKAVVHASPVRVGRPLVLQVKAGGGSWRTTARAKESRYGGATFTLATSKVGTWSYRAVVAASNGAASRTSGTAPIQVLPVPPAAPTGLTATPANGTVALAWTAVKGAHHYVVYREQDHDWVDVSGPVTASAYTVQGLTNGTTESFTVRAIDAYGQESAFATAQSATPVDAAPPAPQGLVATPGDGVVGLAWTAVSASDLAGYRVYRADTADGTPTLLTSTLLTASSYQDSGLTNGTPGWYTVTAVDAGGHESTPSAKVAATPVAPAPVTP
jgi:hypothetical protein